MSEKSFDKENLKGDFPEQRGTDWKSEMDDFRQELKDYRDSHLEQLKGFESISLDPAYKRMFESGDLSTPEDEITRFYPKASSLFEKRNPIDLKKKVFIKVPPRLSQDVHIREFREDREVIRAQIAQMKRRARIRQSEDTAISQLNTTLRNIQAEIPIPRTRADVERSVGENLGWLSGVVIFLGLSVLYRYGISAGWIGEELRVVTGLTLGAVFLLSCYYMLISNSKAANFFLIIALFSCYYTLSLAVHDYFFFSPQTAFLIGAGITAVSFTLSALYQRRNLLFISYAGGFGMPLLLSTGDGNFYIYFTWIGLLAAASLLIAYLYSFRKVITVAILMSCTALIVWAFRGDLHAPRLFGLLVISTIYFTMFLVSLTAYYLRKSLTSPKTHYALVLLIHVLYLTALTVSLNALGQKGWVPVFLGVVAIFDMHYAFVLFRAQQHGTRFYRNFVVLSIILSAVAVFVHFRMISVNAAWAIQSVILLWLGMTLNQKVIKDWAVIVLAAALLAMLYNWTQTYWSSLVFPFMFNKGFLASSVTALSLAMFIAFFTAEKEDYLLLTFSKAYVTKVLGTLVLFIGYATFFFELLWNTKGLIGGAELRMLMIDAYTMLYVYVIRWIVLYLDIKRLQPTINFLATTSILTYILFGHWAALTLREAYLNEELPIYPFLVHYLNMGISVMLVITQIKYVSETKGETSGSYSSVIFFLTFVIGFHVTVEFEHIIILANGLTGTAYDELLTQVRLTGYSVLWSLISLVYMFIGFTNKIKSLRVIALAYFAITLLKFFVFDFWKLQPFAQIIATISIGAILWIASRMYRQLRVFVKRGSFMVDRDQLVSQDLITELTKAKLKNKGKE